MATLDPRLILMFAVRVLDEYISDEYYQKGSSWRTENEHEGLWFLPVEIGYG